MPVRLRDLQMVCMSDRDSKAERTARTRATLLAEARAIFSSQGFAGAGTEAIVRAAEVTRGALYYHFADKQALFEAVVAEEARLVLESLLDQSSDATDRFEALSFGCFAYIQACLEPGTRRIYLLDGPAVLGWPRWRQIDDHFSGAELRHRVEQLLEDSGSPRDPEIVTLLIGGAIREAVLWLSETDDPDDYARVEDTLAEVLRSIYDVPERFEEEPVLKVPPPTPPV